MPQHVRAATFGFDNVAQTSSAAEPKNQIETQNFVSEILIYRWPEAEQRIFWQNKQIEAQRLFLKVT